MLFINLKYGTYLTFIFLGIILLSVQNNLNKLEADYLITQNVSPMEIQENYLNLKLEELNQPNNLTISKINNLHQGYLQGEITINGVRIKSIQQHVNTINLSPLLTRGINRVEIEIDYQPWDSSIQIDLQGVTTSISQVSSGTGKISYILNIMVEEN